MSLCAENVSWVRGGALIIDNLSIEPRAGHTVGLLGPNGSGKSSLLRILQGVVQPHNGVVLLDGKDVQQCKRRDVAQKVAAVTQHAHTETDITVYDVVRLGRTPYLGLWGGETQEDNRAINAALEKVDLKDKTGRLWRSLSGGEKQRVHIARALAQEPRELLMDEPTNHLDIRHQLELLHIVTTLNLTSVIALHDLSLAAMFCDHVVVLYRGKAVAAGSPRKVLTAELIRDVYGVNARVDYEHTTDEIRISYERPKV